MKRYRLLAVVLLCTFLLSACSANGNSDPAKSEENNSYSPPQSEPYDTGSSDAPGETAEGENATAYDPSSLNNQTDLGDRKLIKNGSYELETLEFDKTITALETLVSVSGGYVQSGSVSGTGALADGYERPRYASYVIRIPAGNFESFAERLADCGIITDSRENVDEVTDYYYDLQAHINNMQIQEQRLLTLVGQAGDLETIITLESTLAEVRYKIESYQGQLRRLDSQINLSTVNIQVQEVYESVKVQAVPRTLGERISQRFANTWDDVRSASGDFVVWLLGDSQVILFWLVVLAAVALVIRAIKRRRDGLKGKPHRTFWRRRDGGVPPPSDGANS